MDKKQDPSAWYLHETCFRSKDIYSLKVKGWGKKKFHGMEMGKKKKKARVEILLDKIDFKTTSVIWDKEGHYTMIKGSVQQEV